MEDDNEINIKLELNKDKNQNLSIITYFNTNSSNFFKEGDYYLWKPTLKEKEFIIDAFRLIINSNLEKKEVKNIFKFSDKISDIDKDSEQNDKFNSESKEKNEEKIILFNKNSKLNDDKNKEITETNQENIINETIIKNQINESKLSEDERERKIEKILRENKKKNYRVIFYLISNKFPKLSFMNNNFLSSLFT